MSKKIYVVTWAQSATPPWKPFFASIKTYLKHRKAKLLVDPGRYQNPTSIYSQEAKDQLWWHPDLVPFLVNKRVDLAPELRFFADVNITPTRKRPLSGKNVFVGHNSAIFGHPRRQMLTVATGRQRPRTLWTTGALTVPNYTDSNAGKEGEEHHVYGALIVEISGKRVFVRNISAARDGSFRDLATQYLPNGKIKRVRAAAFTPGDIHAGWEDPLTVRGVEKVIQLCRPKHLFLHDVLDFGVRNHHHKTLLQRVPHAAKTVEDEVKLACAALQKFDAMGPHQTIVVRSNHDEAFDRWAAENDPHKDPLNARYWCEVTARALRHHEEHGEYPMLFETEARRLGVKKVRFLGERESCVVAGVENRFHSHIGIDGARGTLTGFANLGVKVTIDHGHGPAILDGVFRGGVTCQLQLSYNRGPSSWLPAGVLLHEDGKRQMIIFQGDAFHV